MMGGKHGRLKDRKLPTIPREYAIKDVLDGGLAGGAGRLSMVNVGVFGVCDYLD